LQRYLSWLNVRLDPAMENHPMSDKKDTGTDRRALIAAAAAAGVAAAGSAKAFNPQPDPPGDRLLPTQIRVDLGGVSLPVNIARELEAQINRDVLGAISKAGIKAHVSPIGTRPGWYGIILRPAAIPNAAGGMRGPG
jgi:hypothetical protein